jgi:hypothetical protein
VSLDDPLCRFTSWGGSVFYFLVFLFFDEREWIPALALAGEVKIPTADNTFIGTGKTDYGPTLIASKRFGNWDTHVNFGYLILGEPSGVKLKNIFTYAVAAEYHLTNRVDLVGEIIGNTSSSPHAEAGGQGEGGQISTKESTLGGESSVSPEATGEEVSGLLGFRYYLRRDLFLSLGVSYDNNDAFLLRPGVTYWFH